MEKTNLQPLFLAAPHAPINRRAWRRFGLALIVALLIHLLFISQKFFVWVQPRRMPVDLSPVSPQQLDKIREEWKRKEKSFLLNKDKSPPTAAPAPKDARYESDRNRTVEKEQRARQTQVIPQNSQSAAEKQSEKAAQKARSPIGLSQLGVPFHLQRKPTPAQVAREKQSAQIGGDQAIRDQSLPTGGENLLNTVESQYYSFYARLYEAIGPVWQSRINDISFQNRNLAPGDYVTAVEVVLDRAGNLIAVNHLRDSGVPEFDQAVDSAWRRIGRFPNPPRALLGKDGFVRTGWSFAVQTGRSTGLQLAPPERTY